EAQTSRIDRTRNYAEHQAIEGFRLSCIETRLTTRFERQINDALGPPICPIANVSVVVPSKSGRITINSRQRLTRGCGNFLDWICGEFCLRGLPIANVSVVVPSKSGRITINSRQRLTRGCGNFLDWICGELCLRGLPI